MNVTPFAATVQVLLQLIVRHQGAIGLLSVLTATCRAQAEFILQFETVDLTGVSTWSGNYPVAITGVLLTDPDEMLDPAPGFLPWNDGANILRLGGQWQVFVQAVSPGDRGGVECWMGQNYGNLPWLHNSDLSYSDDTWAAEVNRVSHDPAGGRAFRKGDLVTVAASAGLFYGGMQNINEAHSIDPANDFSITLAATNSSLPAPEVISLASIVRTDDGQASTHEDIFDATRATGGEHWQGMRVRINGLTLMTTNGWNPALGWDSRKCAVTDGEGRSFTLVHPRYSLGPAPVNRFDATGVFLQESGSGTDGTFGYELFVQEIGPPDLPLLNVRIQGRAMEITWPASLANFHLERVDAVTSGDWTSTANTPTLLGNVNMTATRLEKSSEFFRLRRVE